VFSAAGLRYVYYFDIRSRRKLNDGAVVDKSAIVQVYAHLLTPPLTSTPDHVRYPNGFEAKRGFGGRVGPYLIRSNSAVERLQRRATSARSSRRHTAAAESFRPLGVQ
jgi:hypothetical protein